MMVYTLNGSVSYLNQEFTDVFGWTLEEMEGKKTPFVPPELQQETLEKLKTLFEERMVPRYETKRLTRDGRILDVIMRGAIFSKSEMGLSGELVILRDITEEKRIARNNEAMLRISMALPEYTDLEMLLDYISDEVKRLLGTEGGAVTVFDEGRQEILTLGAAYDDKATQKRVKGIRLSMDFMNQFVVGKVIKTGKPVIVRDTSKVSRSFPVRDKLLGYQTRNFIQVPLKGSDRIIGVLTAINKKEGAFEQTDIELLNMVAGTVALSVENARSSEELKVAYRELTSLDRAKDKVINHLSHELKTPVSILDGSLNVLEKKLVDLPEEKWKRTIERAKRNMHRLMEIQDEVDDIMRDKRFKTHDVLSLMLDQCADELETLIAEEVGEVAVIERIRKRTEEIFGPKEMTPEKISLNECVKERLEDLKPLFSHRQVEIIDRLEPTPTIIMPPDPLQKVIDGLVKNAIENTPDEGKIEVSVEKKGDGTELRVRDYGVGIMEENQRKIFEGFFPTQDTTDYSSKSVFDFNAGGKGADLLRMKIFSEQYNFKIDVMSSRCDFIEAKSYVCPGKISKCTFCSKNEDCYHSGETTFTLYFPRVPVPDEKGN
jgi:PAS domain S-box-containing protein